MHNKRFYGLDQIFQQCSKHPHPPTCEDDKFHDSAIYALVLDCTAFLSFVDAAKSQPYLQKDKLKIEQPVILFHILMAESIGKKKEI